MTLIENSNRTELRERQDRLLREMLAATHGRNSFVTTRLQAAGIDVTKLTTLVFEDLLAALPFTTKADLVADQAAFPPYGSNLTEDAARYSRLHQTSGTTTGVPMRWLDTPQSWQWVMSCWEQLWRIAGLRPEDRLFFPFSFGPFLGFWAGFEGANRLGNFCLAGGGMTSQARLRLMLDNNITIVCATPTYALRLAETAQSEGLDLVRSSVRMILTAGEPGGSVPEIRQRIESAWGARVCDHWGMTELGPLAMECDANPGGLHLLETECIAEVIDPQTLRPAIADEFGVRRGEIVITNLGRLGSPLIRYRTGDLVTTDARQCPCGSELLRLDGGILSRVDDMVIIRGNNVFPASVEAVLRGISEVTEFRIEVRTERAMAQMKLIIEPTTELSDEAASTLRARVMQAVKDRLNFVPEVELAAPGSLPRFEMKGRRFVRT